MLAMVEKFARFAAIISLAVVPLGCSVVRAKAEQAIAIAKIVQPGHSYQTYAIPSHAMAPTLQANSTVLVDNSAYDKALPARGDIVTLSPPIRHSALFIKRIVAVPGDTLRILDGVVTVNGAALKEAYTADKPAYELEVRNYDIYVNFGDGWQRLDPSIANVPPKALWAHPDRLPKNCYFVLGDDRNDSEDSHIWGCGQNGGVFFAGPITGEAAQPFGKVVKIFPPLK